MAGAAAFGIGALGLCGCSGVGATTRDDAVADVRAEAEALRTDLEAAGRDRSGPAQLEAVRAALPDLPLTVAADGDGVTVSGALTARSESGGGWSYESFVARLCVRYRIADGSGKTEVTDAPCPADVDAVAPADETVDVAR